MGSGRFLTYCCSVSVACRRDGEPADGAALEARPGPHHAGPHRVGAGWAPRRLHRGGPPAKAGRRLHRAVLLLGFLLAGLWALGACEYTANDSTRAKSLTMKEP